MIARLMIVDDHEVVRQGVRTILKGRSQWEICGEAVNGKDAIEQAEKLNPDIVIMDITMPEMGGIEATREMTRRKPHIAVLIFTMHESKHLAEAVREAGARGIVLKSRAAHDLVEALETLMGGGTFFDPEIRDMQKEKEKPDEGAVSGLNLKNPSAVELSRRALRNSGVKATKAFGVF
jgi:DNA-binding NarL/FixJ family response regulator